MSDAAFLASRPCTGKSPSADGDPAGHSEKTPTGKFLAVAAECGVPEAAARHLREGIRATSGAVRARRLTPAAGLRRVLRLALDVSVVSHFLAGRERGTT